MSYTYSHRIVCKSTLFTRVLIALMFGFLSSLTLTAQEPAHNEPLTEEDGLLEETEQLKLVKHIFVEGNQFVPTNAILVKIPFRVGELFDPVQSAQAIKNLYDLNYFNDVKLEIEQVNDTELNLYVTVQEKKKLENIIYEGNDHLTVEEINKKLKLSDIPAIDEEELEVYAQHIKKLYTEKNYHAVCITTSIEPIEGSSNVIARFKIDEGSKAVIKRVRFRGNHAFTAKKLRSLLFTREDWLFGFLDRGAGTYQPEAIDSDRQVLENFYQSNGYLTARVTKTDTAVDPESQNINVTFSIDEGDVFTINSVSAPGNHLISEESLLNAIPVKPGQLYSREMIRGTIEMLRLTWGQFGYIYADIDPAIEPNFETKTVDVTFYSELGKQIFLNRVHVIGNEKTRDYVIRRQLNLYEGQLLTTQQMESSKKRVESLGYFDQRDGVNWKINKVSEGLVDLDLYLHEIKTGQLYSQIGYGGSDPNSPSTSFRISGGISDRNLFGWGVRWNMNLNYSAQDRGVIFSLYQPWIYGRPIGAGLDFYHKKSIYDDFKSANTPVEKLTGLTTTLTMSPLSVPDLGISFIGAFDRIHFENRVVPELVGLSPQQRILVELLYNRRFESGDLPWLGTVLGQDVRNHPIFPSRGYNWNMSTKTGFPAGSSNFGFFKLDLDATWLTPLIGEQDLIFMLHGHVGYIHTFKNRLVPYRELYHVGGPGTVRGFLYGQIGPQIFGDSLGAQKAFWTTAELIFSVTRDQSIRGVLFYDGGAGWDTPQATQLSMLPIVNNRFKYRHSIGFGIRLTKPTPLKVDWGFKLDRNKRAGENFYEVHFSMSQDF